MVLDVQHNTKIYPAELYKLLLWPFMQLGVLGAQLHLKLSKYPVRFQVQYDEHLGYRL